MLDGIPLEGDWVGFPTIYTFPLPQTISRSAADPRRQLAAVRARTAAGRQPDQPQAGRRSRVRRLHRERRRQQRHVRHVQPAFAARTATGITSSTRTTARTTAQRDNGDSSLKGADLHVGYHWNDDALHRARFPRVRARRPAIPASSTIRSSSATRITTHDAVQQGSGPIATSLSLTHKQNIGADARNRRQGLVAAIRTRPRARRIAAIRPTTVDAAGRAVPLHRRRRALRRSLGPRQRVHDRHDVYYHSDAPFRQWDEDNLSPDRYDRFGDPCLSTTTTPIAQKLRQAALDRLRRDLRRERVPLRRRLASRAVGAPRARKRRHRREHHCAHAAVRPIRARSIARSITPCRCSASASATISATATKRISTSRKAGVRCAISTSARRSARSIRPLQRSDPTHVCRGKRGVHGTPLAGLFYDASLFWVERERPHRKPAGRARSRLHGNTINVNTGNTRHRGFEGQIDYDFLAARDRAHDAAFLAVRQPAAAQRGVHRSTHNPAVRSATTPAFSPDYLVRAGVAYREDKKLKLALSVVSVASQYFQDSNKRRFGAARHPMPGYIPAKVPQYTCRGFLGRLVGAAAGAPARRRLQHRSTASTTTACSPTASIPRLGRTFYIGARVRVLIRAALSVIL